MKRSEYLTKAALIAALYIVLSFVSNLFGLSSGVIQFRLSEALCLLPMFTSAAVPGLAIGCLLTNILCGGIVIDVVFGSLATLAGAYFAYLLREKPVYVAALPTILINAIVIGPVLAFAYGAQEGLIYLMASVALGEFVCAGVLGSLLAAELKKRNFRI
ncbi:MAG: QueT transporter family protein [Clostridia bacterium]|nr:QueT transporter family protein [Clostridia bacterium]